MEFLEFYVKVFIFSEILNAFCKMIYKDDIVDRIICLIVMLMIIPVLIYILII